MLRLISVLLMAPNERVVWPQVWLPVQAVYLASQPVSLLVAVAKSWRRWTRVVRLPAY